MDNQISDALLQAVDLVANKRANSAPATLVIEAKIIEVIDEGQGIYKVEYKNNKFEAMTSSSDLVYDINEIVYIVVPNGNFDNNKIILAPVYAETASYASTEGSTSFISLSDSLFTTEDNVITLNTYHSETTEVELTTDNFIKLFTDNLRDSKYFNFTCKIKTNIDKERRMGGNYGLILHIPVLQDGNETEYSVTLDINNIMGDAYNFMSYALQNYYFELPEDMECCGSPHLEKFITGFPQNEPPQDYKGYDIEIKDIGLISTLALSKDTTTGYYLALTASNGNAFFGEQTTKTITPTVLLNGKTTQVNKFDCYWFRENSAVDTSHEKFFKLGGLGWETLNGKTNVQIGEDGRETFQYITNVYHLDIKEEEVHSLTRYKCILVKGTQVISQIISIRNLKNDVEVYLESATGSNTYTKNVGKVRLIVRYYELGVTTTDDYNVTYAWQRFDKFGNYINNDFFTIDRINEKVLKSGKQYYETEISYDTSFVDEANTITCSIYTEKSNDTSISVIKQVIATQSIMITTGETPTYRIKVENGDKLYKYDADGDSPMVADYDGPLSSAIKVIEPINITLYKPDGREFTEDEYAVAKVEWRVPINSLIKLDSSLTTETKDGYYIITNRYNLPYSIAPLYNKNKLDNTIFVSANFLSNTFEQEINLKFLKDGQAGTNGSRFSAIITWNDHGYGEKGINGKHHKLQMIYILNSGWYIYDPASLTPTRITQTNFAEMGIKLYCDGELFNGTPQVEWSIFDLDYLQSYNERIKSPIKLNSNKLQLNGNNWTSVEDNFLAVIEAKCRCQKNDGIDTGITDKEEYVYAYYPIEITYLQNGNYLNGIIPSLDGGYSQVVYASDGTNPQYDTSEPFSVSDSLYNNDVEDLYDYQWSASGNLKPASTTEDNCKVNPTNKYDNGAAQNFLRVALKKSNSVEKSLEERKQEAYNNWQHEQKRLEYYQRLQNAVDIIKEFDYNNYVNNFSQLNDFYKVKTEFVNIDNSLIELLDRIITLADKYDISIKTTAEHRKSTFNILLKYSYQLGVTSNDISHLIRNYSPNSLKINDASKNVTINDNIKKYNSLIENTYNNTYNKLNSSFEELENTNYNIIVSLDNYTKDERWNVLSEAYQEISEQSHLYKELSNNLKTYVSSLSGNDAYSCDKVINNVLNPMRNALSALNGIDYQNIIATIQELANGYQTSYKEYSAMLLPDNLTSIVHIKPIIMLYNRYEMSNVNGWDGNKLKIGANEDYLLAPQVGAGKKENNLFTGMIMGVKQTQVKTGGNQKIGLFGYHEGIQSLFLSAEDGSATFGKSGAAQIIIDPTARPDGLGGGIIKSGNYNTTAKTGMEISLTEPYIKFGSGNFVVNSSGHITAKGGGSIAGWKIGETTNVLQSTNKTLTLDSSGNGKIYSNNHNSLNAVNDGFYLSNDGLSISNTIRISSANGGQVEIGKLSSGKHWIINGDGSNSYISYGTKGNNGSVYLGTDSISLGSKFSVNSAGYLTSTSGKIGGWEIGSSTLKANNITINSSGSISGGVGDSSWSINSNGHAKFTDVTITGVNKTSMEWGNFKVSTAGNLTASSVDLTGAINATSGTIGGCSIVGGNLQIPSANITGKLTASQIETNNLKIGAANITGTTDIHSLTGWEASYASVMSADGTTVQVLRELIPHSKKATVLAAVDD